MIAAIHQPNYLPWLGYFYKMAGCDIFVHLDNVQYTKNGFINRNRIKTPAGSQWLTVDVLTKGYVEQKIKDVRINNVKAWTGNHWKSLYLNYSKAPYFDTFKRELEPIYRQPWENLSLLNRSMNELLAKLLGIKSIEFIEASGLKVTGKGTELLINICKKIGAGTYLSGSGGAKYMDVELFQAAGIKVVYTDFHHPVYRQQWGEFIPGMSIVDLLFNEGEDSLKILKEKSP